MRIRILGRLFHEVGEDTTNTFAIIGFGLPVVSLAATGFGGTRFRGAILLNSAAALGRGWSSARRYPAAVEQPFVPLSTMRPAQQKKNTIVWRRVRFSTDNRASILVEVVGCTGEIQSRRTSFAFICLPQKLKVAIAKIVASQILKRLENSAIIEAMTQLIRCQSNKSA